MKHDKRSITSPLNGQKSRGPITEEGKKISSRNAGRHGLLSETIVIVGESAERFDAHLDRLIDEYHPSTETECSIVEEMAVAKWRQMRIWGMESSDMTEEILSQESNAQIAAKDAPVRAAIAFRNLGQASTSRDSMNRYDARYHRVYHSGRKALFEMRSRSRLPNEPISL